MRRVERRRLAAVVAGASPAASPCAAAAVRRVRLVAVVDGISASASAAAAAARRVLRGAVRGAVRGSAAAAVGVRVLWRRWRVLQAASGKTGHAKPR